RKIGPRQSVPPAANRAVESPGKCDRRALMGSATSQSARRCSSKAARKFQAISRATRSAAASFASGDRRTRLRSSARSTEKICATDAGNKKGEAAADELFQQNGRRIPASQLLDKTRAETVCRRPPR